MKLLLTTLAILLATTVGADAQKASQAPAAPAAPASTCEEERRAFQILVQHLRNERVNSEADMASNLVKLDRALQAARAEIDALKKLTPAEKPSGGDKVAPK